MSNSTAFVVSHLGVLKSGGVVTCATSSCTQGLFTDMEAALEHQIQDSKAKLVVTEEDILPKVMLAVKQCPNVKEIVCARNLTSVDSLPDSVVDFRKLSTGPVNDVPAESGKPLGLLSMVNEEDPGFISRNDIVEKVLMTEANRERLSDSQSRSLVRVTDSNGLAVLPYSDVSDGSPMGLMLTHQNVSSAADIFQMYMERIARRVLTYCDFSQENLLLCSSFASVYGFLCLEIALIMGFTSPRILIMEPMQVVSLLKRPAGEDFKLSSMEYVLCGGPPIGRRVRKQFLDRFTSVKYMTNGAWPKGIEVESPM
ncbi:unnamed protein product [Heligmosomoides polygyrus]|uniref:AMP-binding domain-containing protein n=1 Tax=Heligmosomoides polygyrus TaxID=6339 RepID=A0A3P7ZU82_HELPZ|nr:unnamed protein product [Heligmosomoides polygyrus]